MLDEADAALARLLLPDVPVLLDTSFEILAQGLFNEDPVCPHQETVSYTFFRTSLPKSKGSERGDG